MTLMEKSGCREAKEGKTGSSGLCMLGGQNQVGVLQACADSTGGTYFLMWVRHL